MKIAYIDAKVNNPSEDYSINPKRYGGGAVVARYGKEILNNNGDTFDIFASRDCFDNLTSQDNVLACQSVEDWRLESLKAGAPVYQMIPNASKYDVFLHHHDCMSFNMDKLKAPLVHWALMGDGRANHPNTPYSLLYRHNDKAVYGKTLYVILGKPMSPLPSMDKNQWKYDYLFQCTRHDEHTNSIEVAKECIINKITCVFAGPIFHNYPLMDYIDDKYTFYKGNIDDSTKLDYLKKARACPLLFKWDAPFNQSAIESLSVGTPLIVNPRGFLNEIIKDGENGIIYNGDLADCYNRANFIRREKCHASVEKYSEKNMIGSFRSALQVAINDYRMTHP